MCVSESNCLSFFDPKETTYVMADASPVGLGAVLLQGTGDHKKVITFASKSLTDCEKRYSQTEKEALGLVWAIERFHIYLFGKEFILVTDHKPLQFIFSVRFKPCARIERWILRIQAYKFKVIYISGKLNIADPFSRLLMKDSSPVAFDADAEGYILELIEDNTTFHAISFETIQEESDKDEEIQKVMKCLEDDNWSDDLLMYKILKHELCVFGRIILRGTRIVVPKSLRERVLNLGHEGHPGISFMKNRLRPKLWWPKMDANVEDFVKRCKGCQMVSTYSTPEPMLRKILPTRPWEDIAIDFLGPLPSSHYLFVVVDYYSRFFEVEVMKKIDTPATITALRSIFARFGIPKTMKSDNGPQFVSSEFIDFCRKMGIKLLHSTPYWPQENGEVERQNRSILKRLTISQNLNRNWREHLLDFLLMYRSTKHSVLMKTPSELLFGGRNIRDKLPQYRSKEEEGGDDEGIREMDLLAKEKGKIYADTRRRAVPANINIGDTVLLKTQQKLNKLTPNFSPQEYTVINKEGSEITVENNQTGAHFKRNSSHMKKIPTQTSSPHEDISVQLGAQSSEARPERARVQPSRFADYVV